MDSSQINWLKHNMIMPFGMILVPVLFSLGVQTEGGHSFWGILAIQFSGILATAVGMMLAVTDLIDNKINLTKNMENHKTLSDFIEKLRKYKQLSEILGGLSVMIYAMFFIAVVYDQQLLEITEGPLPYMLASYVIIFIGITFTLVLKLDLGNRN